MVKISGYTTSRNTVSLDYSLKECVQSLLEFADEVVVGDSTDIDDGTRDLLSDLEKSDKRVKVFHRDLDYTTPNHGNLDGEQKSFARSKCTGDVLWQQDLDECAFNVEKIRPFCEQFNNQNNINLVALTVAEYWGSLDKIRCDINPWKERVSKNNPEFTHGIPAQVRVYKDDLLYASPGSSDGCNMIYKDSGELIPCAGFVTEQINNLRIMSVKDSRYLSHYEQWFNDIMDQLPGVFHFSWFSIERKIYTYKKYWNNHWQSLFGETLSDDNMFFNVPWEQVTNEMIKQKAKELREGCGGHIFHQKWNGEKTNHIKINKSPPALMNEWIKNHKDE